MKAQQIIAFLVSTTLVLANQINGYVQICQAMTSTNPLAILQREKCNDIIPKEFNAWEMCLKKLNKDSSEAWKDFCYGLHTRNMFRENMEECIGQLIKDILSKMENSLKDKIEKCIEKLFELAKEQ
ncbi:uncharacterized protein LOC143250529 isoform X2 [Tachypleus tridentatus]|uniref:uncharacterized protein LOC143250529 isoform X2 n=1 Tax=Tachypleus tridentatus TaxID=6853 RepID=UPI003FCFB64E